MKIRIYVQAQQPYGEVKEIKELGTVMCDSAGRACEMYEDELEDMQARDPRPLALAYDIIG